MNKTRSFQTLVICAGTALVGISASAQNLFVIDGGSSVSEYDESGNLVNGSYITGLSDAVGLALDSSDNLYVSYNSDGAGAVAEYNSSGSLITSTFASGLTSAYGMTFDTSGNLYVADYAAASYSEYNSSGNLVSQTPATGGIWYLGRELPYPYGSYGSPYGLAWSPITGSLYYTLNAPNQIMRSDLGSGIGSIGSPSSLNLPTAPEAVAIDSSGNAFLTLPGSGVVQEWNAALKLEVDFATGLNNPTGVVLDGNNDVYVSTGSGILEYNSSGTLLDTIADGNTPGFLAVEPGFSPVPEPGTLALAAVGALAVLGYRRRSAQ